VVGSSILSRPTCLGSSVWLEIKRKETCNFELTVDIYFMICDICGIDVGDPIRMRGHKSGHARLGKKRTKYNSQKVGKNSQPSLDRIPKRHFNDNYWTLSSCWEHPLANKNGQVAEHRKVLFDKIGEGPHPCHWCNKIVSWFDKSLCSDHLDGDPGNNNQENLVPSCGTCNSRRGASMKWLKQVGREDLLWITQLAGVSERPKGPDF
jgi:hypothetical protein